MDAINAESQRLLSASLATSTQVTYTSCVNKFIDFRYQYNLVPAWPSSYRDIMAYMAFMSLGGWAPSSIFTHLSAISYVHKINLWPDPTDCFVVKKMKEGCKRQGYHTDNRRPITYKLLGRLIDVLPSICSSAFEVTLFKAAFMLSFFGFLRVGEFTSPTKSADTSRIIAVSDISFKNEGFELRIRYSKTDQRGISVPLFFQRAHNSNFCPVRAITNFLQIRGSQPGPLFVHFNGGPLTRGQFSHILKKGIKVLGLPPAGFSPHSFRIGAATSAAMCGLSDDHIKALGRWKSTAFQLYIRPGQLDSIF